MGITINYKETILKELEGLTPELIQEIIDFIKFLKVKEVKKTSVDYNSLLIQQRSLGRIWDIESENLYEL